ncbi:ABC transporter permease [Flavobacterium facile]|uniref:ABC transporter permease n=1 Tax=Flavobacterium facile TaxID=2893174 RepID=UPI002E764B27|nr:ABC transporter permease [Flavobacterium sp. T-12]
MKDSVIHINDFLPHRAPMLMVDFLTEINATSVTSVFKIKEDNVFVENNYFSEVGLIENAAQTCSSIVGQTFFFTSDNEVREDVKLVGFISGIKKATVSMLPKVNQTIKTSATLVSRFDSDQYSICTMKCETFQEENLLLEAEINLFIQEVK